MILTTIVATLLSLTCALAQAGDIVPADADQDLQLEANVAPSRVRWILQPQDLGQAQAALADAPGQLVAQLPRLGNRWVLEAAADEVEQVEAWWQGKGTLLRDQRGTPAMVRTTALVGVRDYVWEDLQLRGDATNTIAILDSGVDTAHDDLGDPDFDDADDPPAAPGDDGDWRDASLGFEADLRMRVVGWHDVTDDLPQALGPYDYHRHGTALAGVAFGSGRVDALQSGVAPEGRFVVIKTYNFEERWEIWASDLLLGVDWLLENAEDYRVRACLVGANWEEDLGLTDAVLALREQGIPMIVPAGNDPSVPMGWPARVPEAITVGATDVDGRLAGYSSLGEAISSTPDLLAPGGSQVDAIGALSTCDNEPNDTYRGRVGTSLSAAHVAGAISLVSQVLTETGRQWPRRAQTVDWIEGLLRATAVEITGAEASAPMLPRLGRGDHDPAEGFGLLQIDAVVDAVRREIWPGDRFDFTLGSPLTGPAVWAGHLDVLSDTELALDLFGGVSADFDLYLFRSTAAGVELAARSVASVAGRTESIRLAHPTVGRYYVVAKRVSGDGSATLLTSQRPVDSQWPVRLSAPIASSPIVGDLDGNGTQNVIAVNNVAIDASGHTFYVFEPDGRALAPFPRTFFTSSDRVGELRDPVLADLGSGNVIVAGSVFGTVFGVGADGGLRFQTVIDDGELVTSPAVWGQGASARLIAGTRFGAVVLDAAGAEVDRWQLGASATGPPALGDLDGDGVDEVVVVTQDGKIHVREIEGSLLAGWPQTLAAQAELGTPVLVGRGDGSPPRVCVGDRREDGSAWLHFLNSDGSTVGGFPRSLLQAEDAVVLELADPVASRRERGGATSLWIAALHQLEDGSIEARAHGIDTATGAPVMTASRPVVRPAFVDGLLRVTGQAVSPVRVGDITSSAGAEVWLGWFLAWQELDPVLVTRYGSVHATQPYAQDQGDERLTLELGAGRRLNPSPRGVAPLFAELDGDGRVDVLFPRGNQLFLASGRQPTDPSAYWSGQRADLAGTGCYDCGASVPVAAAAAAGRLRVSVAPNPFNPRTVVTIEAPSAGRAQLTLTDVRGRRLRRWWRRLDAAGTYREVVDLGADVASGVYRVVVEVEGRRAGRSIVLVR